jgi:hypothetical protein
MREIRVSPDGNAVAIRSDNDADGNTAWGIIHAQHGGAWAPGDSVEGWADITPDG